MVSKTFQLFLEDFWAVFIVFWWSLLIRFCCFLMFQIRFCLFFDVLSSSLLFFDVSNSILFVFWCFLLTKIWADFVWFIPSTFFYSFISKDIKKQRLNSTSWYFLFGQIFEQMFGLFFGLENAEQRRFVDFPRMRTFLHSLLKLMK